MFNDLVGIAKEIRLELVSVYWILLVPLTVLLLSLEVVKGKDEKIGVHEIIRRIVISILLLLSFDMVTDFIGAIGDGIMAKLDKYNNSWEALKNLGPNYSGSDKWFDVREYIIYAGALLSYLVAYLGFFMAEALTHFVWITLYVCSPLMILCYVPRQTAGVTGALYKGLIKVVIWKLLWTILGALLLKLALNPNVTGMEDYLFSMVLNLCIGLSMLFIPIATKSLINDGMESASSAIAAIPAAASAGFVKAKAVSAIKNGGQKAMGAMGFAGKPLTNSFTGRAKVLSEKYGPKIDQMKTKYSRIGLPESYKDMEAEKIPLRRSSYDSKENYFKAIDRQLKKEIRDSHQSVGGSQSRSKNLQGDRSRGGSTSGNTSGRAHGDKLSSTAGRGERRGRTSTPSRKVPKRKA